MNLKSTRIFLGSLLAVLALSAAFAGTALAGPVWRFNGEELKTTEKVVGAAEKSGLTVPGMTTTCTHFLYNISISNSAGTGKGSLTELPLFECYTNTKCTVDAIEAESLPWPATLKTVSSVNYIVIEKVKVNILYGNPACAVYETEVEVAGSAGGSIDNATQSATFSPTTFKATGTALNSFGNPVEWNGVFPTEGFEWHREQALSVS
jgi:hypothetical protein